MKKLVVLLVAALSFISCEKDEANEQQEEAKIIGEWEMYRDEYVASIPDQWNGSEWTFVDQWFSNVREDSEIFLDFKEDGTFVDRYATVEVASGTWTKISDNRYSFVYTTNEVNSDSFEGTRFITVYCDNTYSFEVDGNTDNVYYYRKTNTVECSDEIQYNVN